MMDTTRPCPACGAAMARDDTHWSLFPEPMGGYVCPIPTATDTPEVVVPSVDDGTFMANVREALENGYDRVCARCGVGVYDDTDIHERECPEYVSPVAS